MVKTHFIIRVNGEPRSLFATEIKKDGTVLFLNTRTTRETFSVAGPEIKEDRISVHHGHSPVYSTIKQHFRTGDGIDRTVASLTRALKVLGRYAIIKSMVCPDLRSTRYAPKLKGRDQVTEIGTFDQSQGALGFSVFVGHADSGFPPSQDQSVVRMAEHVVGTVHIVILVTRLDFPPTPLGWIAAFATFRPELLAPVGRDEIAEHIEGRTPDECYGACVLFGEVGTVSILRGVIADRTIGSDLNRTICESRLWKAENMLRVTGNGFYIDDEDQIGRPEWFA